jgi:peptide/nickel transport system substrate-binding protein
VTAIGRPAPVLRAVAVAAVLLVCALVAGTAGAASAAMPSTPHASLSGTVYFAELPDGQPDFIFPFMSAAIFSVANTADFQYLMYRPLYSFGEAGDAVLNTSLSIGQPPTYSDGDTTVTLVMKNYRWSDGEQVTAQDVEFWLNMVKVEKDAWADYVPASLPDDIASVNVDSASELTIKLTRAVNPSWYTYDELSQITPFPMAWDVSAAGQAPGSQSCGTASFQAVAVVQSGKSGVTPVSPEAKSCAAVYSYLEKESGYDTNDPSAPNNSIASYATNRLWQVVDGPFQLSSFVASGKAVFVPNPDYSGPVKPAISQFVEVPYSSTTAEYDALMRGQLTVGYLPYEDLTSAARSPMTPGTNNSHLSNFDLVPWYAYGINFMALNYESDGDGGEAGALFQQLYFRQALQRLVDQPLYVKSIFKGYAMPTYGPVPPLPGSPFLSQGDQSDPYPYNRSRAVSLLRAHGWTVRPGAVSVCAIAAKCGVPKGTQALLTLQYAGSDPMAAEMFKAQQASFDLAGIKMSLVASDTSAAGTPSPCKGAHCTWEAEDWSNGWIYSPAYYPSGEALFETGAESNDGSYSNAGVDQLIVQTVLGTADLEQYERSVSRQLPVIWQPEAAYQITEIEKDLRGVTPQNPYLDIDPENWYFAKS